MIHCSLSSVRIRVRLWLTSPFELLRSIEKFQKISCKVWLCVYPSFKEYTFDKNCGSTMSIASDPLKNITDSSAWTWNYTWESERHFVCNLDGHNVGSLPFWFCVFFFFGVTRKKKKSKRKEKGKTNKENLVGGKFVTCSLFLAKLTQIILFIYISYSWS